MCQQIIRQPERLLRNSSIEFIWLYRLKKLLDVCLTQMTLSQTSPTIPLRMLEVFTATSVLERYMEDETRVQAYLKVVFNFLVNHEYFVRLRQLMEIKCPPLDCETLHAPSQFAEAIFQLMLRPLLLKDEMFCIYEEFCKHILAKPFTDPIRSYVLPSLAECVDFPFSKLIRTLNRLTINPQAEKMQIDSTPGTTTSISSFTGTTNKVENLQIQHSEIFSSYLLNAILILDRKHLGKLQITYYKQI